MDEEAPQEPAENKAIPRLLTDEEIPNEPAISKPHRDIETK